MKKIKMFMGAVLCMNLLTLSGCDRVVQSAVVEEKDKTDQKKEENKETVQKTVAEQVGAPETYQATIQADLRSAEREDKENPMKFTLTADAPVKVIYNQDLPLQRFNSQKTKDFTKRAYTWLKLKMREVKINDLLGRR